MSATSSGIWVIFTTLAAYRPMAPPMTSAPTIQAMPDGLTPGPNTVASTARAMPTMPNRLPRREVSGLDSPPRLRMNRMAAPRYATVVRLWDMIVFSLSVFSLLLFAEHGEHAARDGEAPEHVDGREHEGGEGQ